MYKSSELKNCCFDVFSKSFFFFFSSTCPASFFLVYYWKLMSIHVIDSFSHQKINFFFERLRFFLWSETFYVKGKWVRNLNEPEILRVSLPNNAFPFIDLINKAFAFSFNHSFQTLCFGVNTLYGVFSTKDDDFLKRAFLFYSTAMTLARPKLDWNPIMRGRSIKKSSQHKWLNHGLNSWKYYFDVYIYVSSSIRFILLHFSYDLIYNGHI